MPARVLILTGAHEFTKLDWTTNLLSSFQPSVAQFTLLDPSPLRPSNPSQPPDDQSYLNLVVWRSLSLAHQYIRTGFSQHHDLHFVSAFPSSADFLTTASITLDAASQPELTQNEADEKSTRLLTEFYNHSLAVHQSDASSHPAPHDSQHVKPATASGPFFMTNTNVNSQSFDEDERDDRNDGIICLDQQATVVPKPPLKPAGGGATVHLSDLEDIPTASHLLSIIPQTVTVTIIVGVISIAAPRTVETRYGTSRTLVEVLVGDDTKSGFSVTFWLSHREAAESGSVISRLQTQDVVLMQNVALNVFRKKVYGSSLRKQLTKVHLLHRMQTLDEDEEVGYYSRADLARAGDDAGKFGYPQLEKTWKVRNWVLHFVGVDRGIEDIKGARLGKGQPNGKRPAPRNWNQPPPLDSQ